MFLWFSALCKCSAISRALLFKTNNVVCKRFVIFSNLNISNMPVFLLKKCEKLLQKLLSFFQQRISVYLVINI